MASTGRKRAIFSAAMVQRRTTRRKFKKPLRGGGVPHKKRCKQKKNGFKGEGGGILAINGNNIYENK